MNVSTDRVVGPKVTLGALALDRAAQVDDRD